MRLRLNQRAGITVGEAWGSVENFQKYLNEHPCWTFLQKERRFVNGKWVTFPASVVLMCERTKVVLSPPVIEYVAKERDLSYFYRILTVRTANRDDRTDALTGQEVKETIEVQENVPDLRFRPPTPIAIPAKQEPQAIERQTVSTTAPPEPVPTRERETGPITPEKPTTTTVPDNEDEDKVRFLIAPKCPKCDKVLVPERGVFCQSCGIMLPPELAVHREVIVVIKKDEYDRLATHLKQALNAAWSRMRLGRKISWKIVSNGQAIFLITVQDEYRASTLLEEQELSALLEETGAGRLTTDPYELREAHKMLDKQPA